MGNVIHRSVGDDPASQKYLSDKKQLKTAERKAARQRRRMLRPGGWTVMARAIGYRKSPKVGIDDSPDSATETLSNEDIEDL